MKALHATTPTIALALLQLALVGTAQAQSGALYYDAQTASPRGGNFEIEGMAWGYFHTGTLAEPLTLSATDPVSIQLYDKDQGEQNVGGADDELQVWTSDASFTAAAGESVRFEFFSVIPRDLLDAAGETYEYDVEPHAKVLDAPGNFANTWAGATWTRSGRTLDDRASTFSGYPAADHVVRLYYVHPGESLSSTTPGGNPIQTIVIAGIKKIAGGAAVSESLVDSATTQTIWEQGVSGRGMSGFLIVENTSDRDGLNVNLDYMDLMENDYPNDFGNDDDLLATATSTAPSNFNLGPGGTLMWKINIKPEWDAISDAGDLFGADGDLEPYAVFSVSGDPDLPVVILPDADVAAYGEDLPPATFRFAASQPPSPLPPPPIVTFSGGVASYTVDQDVAISCTSIDGGGGIVYDTCFDIFAPAWSFPAGTTEYTASAFDSYGQEGSDTVSFVVEVTPDSLIAITERFVDHNGIENSLVKKIEAARDANTDEAQDANCESYINELEAQSGKHVDAFDADVLIYWAEQLKLQ